MLVRISEYTLEELICIAMSRTEDTVLRAQMRELLEKGGAEHALELVPDEAEFKSFIRNLGEQGIVVVTQKSANYPQRLLRLDVPPIALYCRGNLELLARPMVAMVGTRDCTEYGATAARQFAAEFARRGLVVISGLADGIDTASHLGVFDSVGGLKGVNSAIFSGGMSDIPQDIVPTIGVLGNGLNVFYPKGNRDLQKEMFERALVISEYVPNGPTTKYTFPWRNRIVAVLAQAVVIVEADIKSGTMITATWAGDLGVDVYAIPGLITSQVSRGTHHLIRDGATLATCAKDVLDGSFGGLAQWVTNDDVGGEVGKSNVGDAGMNSGVVGKPVAARLLQLGFEENIVVGLVKKGEVHFDDLVSALGTKPSKVNTLLVNMELAGLIRKLPGNLYFRG